MIRLIAAMLLASCLYGQEVGNGSVVLTEESQTLLNKFIDGDNNVVRIRRLSSGCTSLTDGYDGEPCWDKSAEALYVCKTTDAICDTSGEWIAVSGGSSSVAMVVQSVAPGTATAVADGVQYVVIPSVIDGYTLSAVSAQTVTAGVTGTLNVDLARCDVVATGSACSGTVADMLSTNLTIDSNETRSSTAAAAAVIDTANDDVNTDEVIRIDIDAVHTTAAQGLTVTLVFTP